jgi:hypothetical protein
LIIERFSAKGAFNEFDDKRIYFGQSHHHLRGLRLRIWNLGICQEAIGKLNET